MDAQMTELNARLADVQKELVEMTAQRNKAQAETADVSRRLADSESQAAQLSKLRVALAQQVCIYYENWYQPHHLHSGVRQLLCTYALYIDRFQNGRFAKGGASEGSEEGDETLILIRDPVCSL